MSDKDDIEIQWRFDGRWVDGFELHQVERDDHGTRCQVRRRADGVVLPGVNVVRPRFAAGAPR